MHSLTVIKHINCFINKKSVKTNMLEIPRIKLENPILKLEITRLELEIPTLRLKIPTLKLYTQWIDLKNPSFKADTRRYFFLF